MSKLEPTTDLESVLENRTVMIRFRQFLDSIFSVENLTFWLEAEIYKYLPEEEIVAKAKSIYQIYFSGSPEGTPINLDDMSQELELKKRMTTPARDTFLAVQGIVWGLLKFECFARFKLTPNATAKLSKQEEATLKTDPTVILLDQFLDIRKREKKGKLKAPPMPSPDKELNLDENLYDQPDIEEMFDDEDLMLAFREYLYQTHNQENLAFWLEAELFRRIDDSDERLQRAAEIVEKFCLDTSPYIINCEESLLSKMIQAAKKPTPSTFRMAQKMTWRGLKNEWFPQFCVSELYKEFDKQELEYEKSSPTRKRGNTIDYYEQIVSLKKRLEGAGRDFVHEIGVDDALSPLPAPKTVPARVVPVPVRSPEIPHEKKKGDESSAKKDKKDKKDKKEKEKEKKDKKEKEKKEKDKQKDKKDGALSPKRATIDAASIVTVSSSVDKESSDDSAVVLKGPPSSVGGRSDSSEQNPLRSSDSSSRKDKKSTKDKSQELTSDSDTSEARKKKK